MMEKNDLNDFYELLDSIIECSESITKLGRLLIECDSFFDETSYVKK